MTDRETKRSRPFHWTDLPVEVRARIARRGAGDCRPATTPFYDIYPCRGCPCWLGKAFINARAEFHRVRRVARQEQRQAVPSETIDPTSYSIASESATEQYLKLLRWAHPEREVKADVA